LAEGAATPPQVAILPACGGLTRTLRYYYKLPEKSKARPYTSPYGPGAIFFKKHLKNICNLRLFQNFSFWNSYFKFSGKNGL
jgi:hypothetical protein